MTDPTATGELPTKRCSVCRRQVAVNEWDYSVCDRCRTLAGTGMTSDPFTEKEADNDRDS